MTQEFVPLAKLSSKPEPIAVTSTFSPVDEYVDDVRTEILNEGKWVAFVRGRRMYPPMHWAQIDDPDNPGRMAKFESQTAAVRAAEKFVPSIVVGPEGQPVNRQGQILGAHGIPIDEESA